jgi:hypothetical protein
VFSSGLSAAVDVINRSSSTPAIIMFLTDGDNNPLDSVTLSTVIKQVQLPILFRAVSFGSNANISYLIWMVNLFGNASGKLIQAIDEVELVECFEFEAKELSTKISVLPKI